MNIISEKREQVLRQNNTAQDEFEQLLENIPFDTKEIHITTPLHGDLDLGVLEERGYVSLQSIIFGVQSGTGEITNIKNIPYKLKKFRCTNQMLTSLNLWLPLAEELVLDGNYMETLDLRTLVNLKVLKCNNNKLKEIISPPKSLEEIQIDNNQIKVLDLKDLSNLRILYCVNNPGIKLVNVPRTTLDLKIDEHYRNEVDFVEEEESYDASSPSQTSLVQRDYKEGLSEYFKLKSQYEKKKRELMNAAFEKGKTLKQKKSLAREVVAPCIKCKRRVGTIFEQNNTHFIAICGSKTKPCDLKIELYRGSYDPLDHLIDLYQEMIEHTKEEIIIQKLDTLFNYVSEEKSVKAFKKKLEDYNFDSAFYKKLLDKYHELHGSDYKRELVKQKVGNIYKLKTHMSSLLDEYAKTHNKVVLKTIMDVYVKEYLPEIHNLRLINYEVMEINEVGKDSGVYQLFQRDTKLSSNEYLLGEAPKVKQFRV
jgi:hypothetical protein